MPTIATYKLAGDNLDKNVRPRDMRSDHQTQSFHFFILTPSEIVSDDKGNPEEFKAEHLLPSSDDKKQILDNYVHLYIHILIKYYPYFKRLGKGLQRHITHEYYSEMSHKSEVVSYIAYFISMIKAVVL